MSWINRINDAILRRIRGKAPVHIPGGLRMGTGEAIHFTQLQRVAAFVRPGFVGEDLSLALDFGNGRVVELTENDDAWRATVDDLDADPRTTIKFSEWSLKLISSTGERQTLELLATPSAKST